VSDRKDASTPKQAAWDFVHAVEAEEQARASIQRDDETLRAAALAREWAIYNLIRSVRLKRGWVASDTEATR
jgi:hypothetical protein